MVFYTVHVGCGAPVLISGIVVAFFIGIVLYQTFILLYVLQELRLPSVTTIAIPPGYNWRELLTYIMKHHHMEMTGGLGPSIGMVGRYFTYFLIFSNLSADFFGR